jgi:hypothetical protein
MIHLDVDPADQDTEITRVIAPTPWRRVLVWIRILASRLRAPQDAPSPADGLTLGRRARGHRHVNAPG